METNEIDIKTKNKIIGIIKAVLPDVTIYLYGSFAKNSARRGSDIDIALDLGKKIRRLDIIEIKDMLNASNITHTFDVIDLYAVSEQFKHDIKSGMVLWSK